MRDGTPEAAAWAEWVQNTMINGIVLNPDDHGNRYYMVKAAFMSGWYLRGADEQV